MIVYSISATRDVVRHFIRLGQLSSSAAAAFSVGIIGAEARIDSRPLTYRLLGNGQPRRYSFKVNRTTYLIDYSIEADQVVFLRIWHGRQNRPE